MKREFLTMTNNFWRLSRVEAHILIYVLVTRRTIVRKRIGIARVTPRYTCPHTARVRPPGGAVKFLAPLRLGTVCLGSFLMETVSRGGG